MLWNRNEILEKKEKRWIRWWNEEEKKDVETKTGEKKIDRDREEKWLKTKENSTKENVKIEKELINKSYYLYEYIK